MNVARRKLLVNPRVGKIGDVVHGIVEIEIVVVHAVHEIAQIIDAGHGEAALDDVRMLEEQIGGVIRAERCTHRGDRRLRFAIVPDERNDFFAQIGIKHGLHVAAMKGVRTLVVETAPVDGVDGVKLDAAGVNEIGEGPDHSLSFKFPFVASAGGETKNGRAPVTINDDTKFHAEAMRIPAVIIALHEGSLSYASKLKPGRRKYASRAVRGQRRAN